MSGRYRDVKVSRGKLQPHYAVVVDIFMQIHLVVCRAIRSTNRAPMHRVLVARAENHAVSVLSARSSKFTTRYVIYTCLVSCVSSINLSCIVSDVRLYTV